MITNNTLEDPILLSLKQLVSTSKLSKNLGKYLNQVQEAPLFVMRGSEPEAVLLNINDYRILLKEEERTEEIHEVILALRRLLEHKITNQNTVSNDDMLLEFGFTRKELED